MPRRDLRAFCRDAGERLIATLGPMLHDLDSPIASLGELRDWPSGIIHLTTVKHVAKTILVPAMTRLLPGNPDITVELTVDYGLTDVVADRFDAAVHPGGEMAKDMIAVRIGPDIPMAMVGSPDHFHYFRARAVPNSTMQLIRVINLRLPTSWTLNVWRPVRGGKGARGSRVRWSSTPPI